MITGCTIALRSIADAIEPSNGQPVTLSADLATQIAAYLRATDDMHVNLLRSLNQPLPTNGDPS